MKSYIPGTGRAAQVGGEPAEQFPTETLPAAELPADAGDSLMLPVADDEPFVPKSRYVMGRSTKVLVCVVLVAAGMFTGSAIQKQIDAGTRGPRTNFGTVQGPGAGTGTGSGSPTPGQGRRGGGTAGTAGGAGSGAPTTAPSAGTGQ
ncbi:hypothetical protein AB4Y86_06510 [Arthrobacter sp. 2YAF22_2]|uniref:hypothetical protein n=1 Tax=Arthrobacter sp. 2YAF22_2 TaxID=3233029 RepID=UPI003F8FEFFE